MELQDNCPSKILEITRITVVIQLYNSTVKCVTRKNIQHAFPCSLEEEMSDYRFWEYNIQRHETVYWGNKVVKEESVPST